MPASPLKPVSAYRLCLLTGLAIVALQVWSSVRPQAVECGDLAANYRPIIAFELARTEQELHALFGDPGDCRDLLVLNMDVANWLDILVFIPIYGCFLALFFVGIRERQSHFASYGLWFVVIAVVGDLLENACLMNMTPALDPGSAWFAFLPWATGLKWLALGAVAAIAAWIYVSTAPKNYVFGVLCAASAVIALAGIAQPSQFGPFLGNGVALGWLVILLTAALRAFRRS
jgi:hypothetical protein